MRGHLEYLEWGSAREQQDGGGAEPCEARVHAGPPGREGDENGEAGRDGGEEEVGGHAELCRNVELVAVEHVEHERPDGRPRRAMVEAKSFAMMGGSTTATVTSTAPPPWRRKALASSSIGVMWPMPTPLNSTFVFLAIDNGERGG